MQLIFDESNNAFHVAWLSRLPVSRVRNYQLPLLYKGPLTEFTMRNHSGQREACQKGKNQVEERYEN
ncbi:hypothetical protein KSC_005620 [Ktedonobacter sp. SOSP1-52]|uniref:hypothetical protein n=1 Tax=Ktedonobacter sp. SOSP1-52 TaxID=2778366 RepID=UPI0019160B04|nr:hypothetical protein [Ktedonobacter sp. SOSP1-52]GHO61670.1 hypothetical protein KSC_005620 [Ktedonobacter sp. SOSP1-52]